MKLKSSLIVFLFLFTALKAQVSFDDYFEDKTLRFDYFHSGDFENELYSFDKLIDEGDWNGSKINLVDTIQYGNSFLKIFSLDDGNLIYSRGFSTLFREWQTTEEAKKIKRTFYETVTFPFPKDSVRLELLNRDSENRFVKKLEMIIDPEDPFIKEKEDTLQNFKVHYSGDPEEKLDIVFLPEGYTASQMDKFRSVCDTLANYLFEYKAFGEHRDKINIWGVNAPSKESGTDIPHDDQWRNTELNSSFYTFGSERYLMTTDYFSVRDAASNAPYEQIYILVNTEKYGGGSIYNYYSMISAEHPAVKEIFIHELGHGFAGLADEYVTDDVAYLDFYNLEVEPWEANITTLVDFDSKWKYMLDSEIPIPTPDTTIYQNKTGVFEGGGYIAKGIYRPTKVSVMNSLSAKYFNEPSKEAIRKLIEFYSN